MIRAPERTIGKTSGYSLAHGMRHRTHGRTHKSIDVLTLQDRLGSAVGVCCPKVSKPKMFVPAVIRDVLVSDGGTGTYTLEATSGAFTILRCGPSAVMDAVDGRIPTQRALH